MPETTPKRLVLSLLSAPELEEAEISKLVLWAGLFGVDAATLRVTVGRLTRQGLLTSPRRGVYRIGPQGEQLTSTAQAWASAEHSIVPWHGEWLMAHTAHLGRSNKTRLRGRERAFRLNGFAQCVSGLWCRPANLDQDIEDTRGQLIDLGLDDTAPLLRANAISGVSQQQLFALWPRKQLEKAYKQHLKTMHNSRKKLPRMALADAARETILVGEAVIRQINADPLLPEQMIDTHSRSEMIATMLEYDSVGRDIWRQFTALHN